MSEAGTVFGMSVDCAVIRNKLGAAGISTLALQTRVVDGNGDDCRVGVVGELLLRRPNRWGEVWGIWQSCPSMRRRTRSRSAAI